MFIFTLLCCSSKGFMKTFKMSEMNYTVMTYINLYRILQDRIYIYLYKVISTERA